MQNCLVFDLTFCFFTFFSCDKIKSVFGWFIKKINSCVVATSNNITNNQAPVPSVCVRVPHSPSLDSGENSVSSSPVEKAHHDFATLVVREFVKPKKNKTDKNLHENRFLISLCSKFCMQFNSIEGRALPLT